MELGAWDLAQGGLALDDVSLFQLLEPSTIDRVAYKQQTVVSVLEAGSPRADSVKALIRLQTAPDGRGARGPPGPLV